MCVICVKKKGLAYPEDKYLKNCFENNNHGAGFMVPFMGKVRIRKGFATYEDFKAALDKMREKVGDDAPCVMHFRIATQGYDRGMTHPFPLSSKMGVMTALKSSCNIGVAHNGILELTSDGARNYSDTMKFIADYLSLIIRNFDWYKDKRSVKLIERLIDGSRLAIMDKNGTINLLGKGWVKAEDGCWYSNESYKREKPKYTYPVYSREWDLWEDDGYDIAPRSAASNLNWERWKTSGEYNFSSQYCPFTECDDDSYCEKCRNKKNCHYYQAAMDVPEVEEKKPCQMDGFLESATARAKAWRAEREAKKSNLVTAQTIGKKAACL
jgi:hypothetical protein